MHDAQEDTRRRPIVATLREAGFDNETFVQGDEGVQLLERADGFFFSDADGPVLERQIEELKAGHYVFAVRASGGDAENVAEIASDHGARFLVHFGFAATTWLKE